MEEKKTCWILEISQQLDTDIVYNITWGENTDVAFLDVLYDAENRWITQNFFKNGYIVMTPSYGIGYRTHWSLFRNKINSLEACKKCCRSAFYSKYDCDSIKLYQACKKYLKENGETN